MTQKFDENAGQPIEGRLFLYPMAQWHGKCANCGENGFEVGSKGGTCKFCMATTILPEIIVPGK